MGAVVVWALQTQRVSRSVLDQVAARPEPLMVNLLRSYPHAARRTVTPCELGAPLDPFPTRDFLACPNQHSGRRRVRCAGNGGAGCRAGFSAGHPPALDRPSLVVRPYSRPTGRVGCTSWSISVGRCLAPSWAWSPATRPSRSRSTNPPGEGYAARTWRRPRRDSGLSR